MTGTVSDIDWEIKQLEEAILYYEDGIANATTLAEIDQYRRAILHFYKLIANLRKEQNGNS